MTSVSPAIAQGTEPLEPPKVRAGAAPAGPGDMWEPDLEAMPRADLRLLQSERLREQVARVYEQSWLFRERMDEAGVRPRDVTGVDQLGLVPVLAKDHLRAARARTGDVWGGALCVPSAQMVIVTHSTGTSGRPNFYGLTSADLRECGRAFARSSYAAGIRPGDHVTIGASGHGAFVGWTEAFEQMGVVKVYLAGPQPSMLANLLELAPDMDCITALFVYQAETELRIVRDLGIKPREVFPNLRLLWSAVDASPARRQLLLEAFGVPLRNQYGSGDQFWMTGECPVHQSWMHVPEDMFIFEVLDPAGQPVPPGGTGVLHVTNLYAQACPYLRYDMEDVVSYQTDPCECGRTSMRVRVRGRLAWAVLTPGGYIFSTDVEHILWADPRVQGADYLLLRQRRQPQEDLTVQLAVDSQQHPGLTGDLSAALSAQLGLPVRVELAGQDGIDRTVPRGKRQRVADEPPA